MPAKTSLSGWILEAWAVLHNHYHFIAQAPENATILARLIQQIHLIAAIQINKWDNASSRRAWQNYWDTCITYPGYRIRQGFQIEQAKALHKIAFQKKEPVTMSLRETFCDVDRIIALSRATIKVMFWSTCEASSSKRNSGYITK